MAEYADKSMEEVASEFIVCTCPLLPKSYPFVPETKLIQGVHTDRVQIWSSICGSTAELLIQPLNPCITDIDCLTSEANKLAFTEDVPVMLNDVSSLFDTITCYKIEPDIRYPSFVRLRLLGKMDYNWKCKRFEFMHAASRKEYVRPRWTTAANYATESISTFTEIVSGPAFKCQLNPGDVTYDIVNGVRCPQWPKEAKSWPKRLREYGWPTTDIISEVVEQGCHVIYVQHRACRDDEAQWRLSFSIAEVILLQSWTHIQQIVYHLLRFFAKRELIRKDCPKEDEVLCTCHLKTLMLWTCEQMSLEWWNSSSVIVICCELLRKLSEWLKRGSYPNYFIPEANLFIRPLSSTMLNNTERRLNEYKNSGILCQWFVDYYMQPLISDFENTIRLNLMPHDVCYMPHVIEYRKAQTPNSLDFLFSHGFLICNMFTQNTRYGIRSGLSDLLKGACCISRKFSSLRYSTMSILQKTENVWCFTYYDITVFGLNAAYNLGCGNVSWDSELFVEYVNAISLQPKIVRSQYHIFPKQSTAARSQRKLLLAQDVMEILTGSNSRSEFELLSILAKEFLRKALECDDSQRIIIAPAATVCLAALHFASSENQIVISLCSAVLMDQTNHRENDTLNAGCLFFIDDVVRIVGFCLLYKKLSDKIVYKGKHIYLDLRLTPKVFAYYLTVISAERIFKQLLLNLDLPTSAFSLDHLLLVLTKRKSTSQMHSSYCFNIARQCVYRRTDSLTANVSLNVNPVMVKETLIDILTDYALENMTSFYKAIRKDFGIQCNTVDCYRALHFYKCRQYDEMLDLCDRILREPDLQGDLKELSLANVLVIPPLDSFFDGDVQSLLGFHTLFCYLCPLNDDLRKVEVTCCSTFTHNFARQIYYDKNLISDCLNWHYSIMCHYFIGGHFLASYLKLRCCVDCSHPFTESIDEFAAMKSNLPFEHIIRRFLLLKLRSPEKKSKH